MGTFHFESLNFNHAIKHLNMVLAPNFPLEYLSTTNLSRSEPYKLKTPSGYNILIFDNVNSAKNCKISLQNPLLRFTLSKLQTG